MPYILVERREIVGVGFVRSLRISASRFALERDIKVSVDLR